MSVFKMTKEAQESTQDSKRINQSEWLREVQIGYATSAAVKDSGTRNKNLGKAGKPLAESLYEGEMYFYTGKEEETELATFQKLPDELDIVVVDIRGEGEAWKDIKSQDKKTASTVEMPFDPECPQFVKRPEFTEFCELFEGRDDITVKLSHRVLVYIPSLKEFATIYFKYSTTSDYADLMDCVGDGNIIKISVYKQDLKGGATWYRFRSTEGELFTETIDSEKALSLFK